MRGGRVNEVSKQCYQPPIPLTLFPCISTHLKVIDSTYFIQTYKPMSYSPPPPKKNEIEQISKMADKSTFKKKFVFAEMCAIWSNFNILSFILFCKHPYFDSTD